MLASRVLSRKFTTVYAHCRSFWLLSLSQKQYLPTLSNDVHSLCESPNKVVNSMDTLLLQPTTLNSSASPKPSKKKSIQTVNEHRSNVEKHGASTNAEAAKTNGDAKVSNYQKEGLGVEKHGACTNAEPAKTNGDAKVSNAKFVGEQLEGLGFGMTTVSQPTKESRSDLRSQHTNDILLEGDLANFVAEVEEFLKLRFSCQMTERVQDSIVTLEKRQEKIIRRLAKLKKNQEKFLHGHAEMEKKVEIILHNCSETANAQDKLFLKMLDEIHAQNEKMEDEANAKILLVVYFGFLASIVVLARSLTS